MTTHRLSQKNPHPMRRAEDRELLQREEDTLDALAQRLCPADLLEKYRYADFVNQRGGKNVTVFPIWRRYRREALKVRMMYREVPWLRHLPPGVAQWLTLLLLK